MYIIEALNHNINGSPNNTPIQEVTNNTKSSFFEQMIASGSMQKTSNITSHEPVMNKVMQQQDIESKTDVIATNDEENKEGKNNSISRLIC